MKDRRANPNPVHSSSFMFADWVEVFLGLIVFLALMGAGSVLLCALDLLIGGVL
jgi:hypothetical protein